jgi:hypothetical protein
MPQWVFEHMLECSVPIEFAWGFWTNVKNWVLDADVASIQLHGEFAAGTSGVTHSKSAGRIAWRITETVPPRKAVLEFPAPGAVAEFVWIFEDMGARTRITQRASFSGEQAALYADTIGPSLATGIPAGMRKLCEAMEAAAPSAPE